MKAAQKAAAAFDEWPCKPGLGPEIRVEARALAVTGNRVYPIYDQELTYGQIFVSRAEWQEARGQIDDSE